MSALAGPRHRQLHVDLAGPEVPIMDGSAGPVRVPAAVGGHRGAGARRSATSASRRRSRCSDGDKWARFEPFDGFKLDFTIDFPHPVFGIREPQRRRRLRRALVRQGSRAARAPSASCRTSRRCARAGLALGGSLDNAIVLDEFRVLNSDGLRYDDEFVKHKVLDAIGDLYLLGHPLIGAVHARTSRATR